MTRKRYTKLLMARGCDRNYANLAAAVARRYGIPYAALCYNVGPKKEGAA